MTYEEKKAIEENFERNMEFLARRMVGTATEIIILEQPMILMFKDLIWRLEKKDMIIDKIVKEIIDYKDYLERLSDNCQQDCFLYNKVIDCNLFKDCKFYLKEYFEKEEEEE